LIVALPKGQMGLVFWVAVVGDSLRLSAPRDGKGD
jgi:hypothetical protein